MYKLNMHVPGGYASQPEDLTRSAQWLNNLLSPIEASPKNASNYVYIILYTLEKDDNGLEAARMDRIFLSPETDAYCVMNIPLEDRTFRVDFGIATSHELVLDSVKSIFSYPNGLAETTRSDHFPVLDVGMNFITLDVPKAKDRSKPNQFHLCLDVPSRAREIFDFGEYKLLKAIPPSMKEGLKVKEKAENISSEILRQYDFLYNEGRDFKQAYLDLAKQQNLPSTLTQCKSNKPGKRRRKALKRQADALTNKNLLHFQQIKQQWEEKWNTPEFRRSQRIQSAIQAFQVVFCDIRDILLDLNLNLPLIYKFLLAYILGSLAWKITYYIILIIIVTSLILWCTSSFT